MERAHRFPFALAVAGLVLALGLALAVGPSEAPAKEAAASKAKQAKKKPKKPKKPKKKPKKPMPLIKGLYNSRYCEIFGIGPQDGQGNYEIQVFNTVGINLCPDAKWTAINLTTVASANGWSGAVRNGPRFWVMDQIRGKTPPAPVTFGELPMRRVAILRIPGQPDDFTPFQIERRTQWIFRKGRTVRELIAPNGRRYVMQAYTTNVDSSLTEDKLDDIGSNPQANIPEGWTFRTRKLRHQLVMSANGTATILRDGLKSVYQQLK